MKRYSWFLLFSVLIFSGVPRLALAQEPLRTLEGTIDNTNAYYELAFSVEVAGGTITIDHSATSGDLDTLAYLVDDAGNIIEQNDDRARDNTNALIVFPNAERGAYRAIATRYGVEGGNTAGTFTMTVTVTPPSPDVRLEYDVTPEALLASGFPTMEVRPQAEWTIIAYYGADTDLEPGILKDFKEFEKAGGSSDSVRIVMLMDRHPGITDASGNWHSTKIFEVGDSNNDTEIDSVEIADLGLEFASSDGQLLAQYLVWAITHFPAKNYAVAFASHGAAWEGLIQDDTPEEGDNVSADGKAQKLSLQELDTAFAIATETAGQKIGLLVNDACLMSSVEYYAVMSRYVNMSIASPEVVIDPALDMTTLVNFLNADPNGNVIEFSKRLIDIYIDEDIQRVVSPDIVYLTHSVTDLNKFDPVTEAIENFAQVFNQDPARNAIALGNARKNTYTYSHFLGSETKVDLGDLMRRVVVETKNIDLKTAASKVIEALQASTLYSRSGGEARLAKASYYNIYFPETVDYFRGRAYFGATPLPEWAKMLRSYYSSVTPKAWSQSSELVDFHPPVAPSVHIANVFPLEGSSASIVDPVQLRTEIVGRNIANVNTTVDQLQPDGTAIRLSTERLLLDTIDEEGNFTRINSWNPGLNQGEVIWDAKLPVVTDGNARVNELVVFTDQVAFLEGYYRPSANEQWRDVTVVFDVVRYAGQIGRVQRVISRSGDSESAGNITINPGADFVAFRSRVTPDGVAVLELSTNYLKWPEGGITYSWEPAPNGTYRYGILATAFGGTTGYDGATVIVDNTGVDNTLRGATKPNLGFSFAHPAEWTFPLAYSLGQLEPLNVELERTTSPDGTLNEQENPNADGSQNFTVYYISEFDNNMEPVPNDLQYIADLLVGIGGFTVTSDFIPGTFKEVPTLAFDYTYETSTGVVAGKAIVTFNAFYELGVIFSAEAKQGNDVEAVYALLTANLHLFDNEAVAGASQAVWGRVFRQGFSLARPRGWASNDLENGFVRWSAGGDIASPTFFAYRSEETNGQTVEGVATDLTSLLSEVVLSQPRAYNNTTAWDSVSYTATRDGMPVYGRVYLQLREDNQAYIIWMETPNDDTLIEQIAQILEVMIDSWSF